MRSKPTAIVVKNSAMGTKSLHVIPDYCEVHEFIQHMLDTLRPIDPQAYLDEDLAIVVSAPMPTVRKHWEGPHLRG